MFEPKINLTTSIVLVVGGMALLLGSALSPIPILNVSIQEPSIRWALAFIGLLMIVAAIVIGILEATTRSRETRVRERGEHRPAAANFLTSVEDRGEKFEAMMAGARKIDVLAITGVNLLSQQRAVFEDVCRQGCRVRLLFLDPSSHAARIVYGGHYDVYRHNISASLQTLAAMKRELGQQLEVKALPHAPTLSVLSVTRRRRGLQRQSFVQVQLYFLRAMIGANRPIFRVDSGDKWYAVFCKEFELLWDSVPGEWSFDQPLNAPQNN